MSIFEDVRKVLKKKRFKEDSNVWMYVKDLEVWSYELLEYKIGEVLKKSLYWLINKKRKKSDLELLLRCYWWFIRDLVV